MYSIDKFSSRLISREKIRQLQVNDAFFKLRLIIPAYPANRKMSKHEILKSAIRYIKIMEYILSKS
uniref:BHLH domain-containing protein n=1 Tax=Strongyloides stercoralis TaxID=6248 RepID=A0A0K0EC04_STRER